MTNATAEAISAKVAKRAQKRRESDAAEYRALLRAVADNDTVDLNEADRLLAYLKIDDQTFKQDVARFVERRAARKVIDDAEASQKRHAEVSQELADLGDAHRKLVEAEYAKYR